MTTQTTRFLLEKIAIISPAQDAALKQRLEAKAQALAEARGATIPNVLKTQYTDPYGGLAAGTQQRRVPAPEQARISSIAAKSPMVEKEIIKQYGTVSNSPLKELRHRTVGKIKRLWAGQGGLGGKIRNRAGMLGGLAALGGLGLGVKNYLDSQKQDSQTMFSPEYLQSLSQQEQGYPQDFVRYAAAGFDDVAKTPKPPSPPTISTPGTAVGNIKLDTSFGASSPNFASTKGFGGSSTKSKNTTPFSKKAGDNGVNPLLAGLAGGVGGFVAGDKLIRPMISAKEEAIKALIANKEQQLGSLRNLNKLAPIGAATAGAILLAAVAAAMGNKKGREMSGANRGMTQEEFVRHILAQQRAQDMGFSTNDQTSPFDLSGMYE
jgi:hypothetical protein